MAPRTVSLTAACAVLSLTSLDATAFAATQIFSLSSYATANQPGLPYDLGMDFTVNETVIVYSLGAFTNGSSSIPVTLYSSAGNDLASATISAEPPSGSNYAFSTLATPVTLTPGTYQIEAAYSSDSNGDYNPLYNLGGSTVVFDNLGGSLTFLGDYYSHGSTGAMATTFDALSPNGYGAGSFLASATDVPEPSVWTLMLVGFGALGAMRRSRRKQALAVA